MISKITIARSVENSTFQFLSPQFSMQSEISRKNVFVPWGISKVIQFLPDILFKGNLKAYCKVRQLNITKCDSLVYYKVRQLFYHKVRQFHYEVRQVSQSAMIITKCDRTLSNVLITKNRAFVSNVDSGECVFCFI